MNDRLISININRPNLLAASNKEFTYKKKKFLLNKNSSIESGYEKNDKSLNSTFKSFDDTNNEPERISNYLPEKMSFGRGYIDEQSIHEYFGGETTKQPLSEVTEGNNTRINIEDIVNADNSRNKQNEFDSKSKINEIEINRQIEHNKHSRALAREGPTVKETNQNDPQLSSMDRSDSFSNLTKAFDIMKKNIEKQNQFNLKQDKPDNSTTLTLNFDQFDEYIDISPKDKHDFTIKSNLIYTPEKNIKYEKKVKHIKNNSIPNEKKNEIIGDDNIDKDENFYSGNINKINNKSIGTGMNESISTNLIDKSITNQITHTENSHIRNKSQQPFEKLKNKLENDFVHFLKKHRYSAMLLGNKKYEGKAGDDYLKSRKISKEKSGNSKPAESYENIITVNERSEVSLMNHTPASKSNKLSNNSQSNSKIKKNEVEKEKRDPSPLLIKINPSRKNKKSEHDLGRTQNTNRTKSDTVIKHLQNIINMNVNINPNNKTKSNIKKSSPKVESRVIKYPGSPPINRKTENKTKEAAHAAASPGILNDPLYKNIKMLMNDGENPADLTPIPYRATKPSKGALHEYTQAERAAVTIRRIEYSCNLKGKREENSIDVDAQTVYIHLILEAKAIIIQRWWRSILKKLFKLYICAIFIQKVFRGHLFRIAFKSIFNQIKFTIPFIRNIILLIETRIMRNSLNNFIDKYGNAAWTKILIVKIDKIKRAIKNFILKKNKKRNILTRCLNLLALSILAKAFKYIQNFIKISLNSIIFIQSLIRGYIYRSQAVLDINIHPYLYFYLKYYRVISIPYTNRNPHLIYYFKKFKFDFYVRKLVNLNKKIKIKEFSSKTYKILRKCNNRLWFSSLKMRMFRYKLFRLKVKMMTRNIKEKLIIFNRSYLRKAFTIWKRDFRNCKHYCLLGIHLFKTVLNNTLCNHLYKMNYLERLIHSKKRKLKLLIRRKENCDKDTLSNRFDKFKRNSNNSKLKEKVLLNLLSKDDYLNFRNSFSKLKNLCFYVSPNYTKSNGIITGYNALESVLRNRVKIFYNLPMNSPMKLMKTFFHKKRSLKKLRGVISTITSFRDKTNLKNYLSMWRKKIRSLEFFDYHKNTHIINIMKIFTNKMNLNLLYSLNKIRADQMKSKINLQAFTDNKNSEGKLQAITFINSFILNRTFRIYFNLIVKRSYTNCFHKLFIIFFNRISFKEIYLKKREGFDRIIMMSMINKFKSTIENQENIQITRSELLFTIVNKKIEKLIILSRITSDYYFQKWRRRIILSKINFFGRKIANFSIQIFKNIKRNIIKEKLLKPYNKFLFLKELKKCAYLIKKYRNSLNRILNLMQMKNILKYLQYYFLIWKNYYLMTRKMIFIDVNNNKLKLVDESNEKLASSPQSIAIKIILSKFIKRISGKYSIKLKICFNQWREKFISRSVTNITVNKTNLVDLTKNFLEIIKFLLMNKEEKRLFILKIYSNKWKSQIKLLRLKSMSLIIKNHTNKVLKKINSLKLKEEFFFKFIWRNIKTILQSTASKLYLKSEKRNAFILNKEKSNIFLKNTIKKLEKRYKKILVTFIEKWNFISKSMDNDFTDDIPILKSKSTHKNKNIQHQKEQDITKKIEKIFMNKCYTNLLSLSKKFSLLRSITKIKNITEKIITLQKYVKFRSIYSKNIKIFRSKKKLHNVALKIFIKKIVIKTFKFIKINKLLDRKICLSRIFNEIKSFIKTKQNHITKKLFALIIRKNFLKLLSDLKLVIKIKFIQHFWRTRNKLENRKKRLFFLREVWLQKNNNYLKILELKFEAWSKYTFLIKINRSVNTISKFILNIVIHKRMKLMILRINKLKIIKSLINILSRKSVSNRPDAIQLEQIITFKKRRTLYCLKRLIYSNENNFISKIQSLWRKKYFRKIQSELNRIYLDKILFIQKAFRKSKSKSKSKSK